MRFDAYMGQCLMHPEHGYYTQARVFGAKGDFVTAPEISQMFGELIGLALAQAWLDQGGPAGACLVELGPGRGTLMADIRRATRGVSGFAGLPVHMVETSPLLRGYQRAAVPNVVHHDTVETLPEAPLFLIANEFFDALPIRQFQRTAMGWREAHVGLVGDTLTLGWGPEASFACLGTRTATAGDIIEVCPALPSVVGGLAQRLHRHGGAALIIDYGDWRSLGDTVQAVRHHRPTGPLATPGTADITAHVDFEAIARHAAPATASAMVPQGVFLERPRYHRPRPRLGQRADGGGFAATQRGPSPLDPPRRDGHPVQSHGAGAHSGGTASRVGRTAVGHGGNIMLEIIQSPNLRPLRHGFFTRKGGVSSGIYAGLNCGRGSGDQSAAVARNRACVAAAMDVDPTHLQGLNQCHSAHAVIVDGPLAVLPKADALVTCQPGLALSVLTADCQPILLADRQAGVVAAAHAGWKGTLGGVIENTVAQMERLGAQRSTIHAVIGPSISQRHYEVGPEFYDRFVTEDPAHAGYFTEGRGGKYQFDLPRLGLARLRAAGISHAAWTGQCTYADPHRFYSFRRSTHEGQPDYGRLIATIRL